MTSLMLNLSWLHSVGIAHLDLHEWNVLVKDGYATTITGVTQEQSVSMSQCIQAYERMVNTHSTEMKCTVKMVTLLR